MQCQPVIKSMLLVVADPVSLEKMSSRSSSSASRVRVHVLISFSVQCQLLTLVPSARSCDASTCQCCIGNASACVWQAHKWLLAGA